MSRTSRTTLAIVAAVAVVAIGGAVLWRVARHPAPKRPKVAALRPGLTKPVKSDRVSIKGVLYDEQHGTPVAAVTVVLLGPAGEVSSTTTASGNFEFEVAPGRYRAFVRDTDWLTPGLQERIRLDDGPDPRLAGALDARIAPRLDAETDLDHLELTTSRAAKVTGHVYDDEGEPVVGAAVRMRQPPIVRTGIGTDTSFLRPVLGTDTAITNEDGEYALALPLGVYDVDLRHPSFAGATGSLAQYNLDPGAHLEETLHAIKGCIVRGKVVMADGKTPSPDGAIEIDNSGGTRFGPMARVNTDGTFEFATTRTGFFSMRAWPWKSAPSRGEEVACTDGKRNEHVTLTLGDRPPDLAGTLIDAKGNRVPFTFVDLDAVAPDVNGQQERSNAGGEWHVYDAEPGQYRIIAAAEGRGVADMTVVSPKQDVELRLSGVGRISGTTTELVDGSLQVSFLQCGNNTTGIDVPPETQIVPVHGGRFTIESAPACALRLNARWRTRTVEATVVVEPNATAYVSLDLGAAAEKTVRGVVQDSHGAPAPNVPVTALIDQREASTVRTDRDGRYTITTRSGAELLARSSGKVGRGTVGKANVPGEVVDIVLDTDTLAP